MALRTTQFGGLLPRALEACVRRNRRSSFVEISSTSTAHSSVQVDTILGEESNELQVEDKDGKGLGFLDNDVAHCSSFEDPCDHLPVTFSDVSTAAYRIRDSIVRSKCKRSTILSELCGMEVYLKKEFLQ